MVDQIGISIHGQRIEAPPKDPQRTLDEVVAQSSPGRGTVPIFAYRGAAIRWISALVQALGKTGVEEIDLTTPTSGATAKPATLKVSPLGQVPMHEDRCGGRVTFKADNEGELKYLQKGRAVKLPRGAQGAGLSKALDEIRKRMKGCGSTLWMLAGEGRAQWGPAFDVGMEVTNADTVPGVRQYIMLL
jgi:hypothetical protein